MSRYLKVLVILMLVQIIVAAIVYLPKSSVKQSAAALLAIDPAVISSIQLSDMQNNSLLLTRNGDDWFVDQQASSVPANSDQINTLIESITRLPTGQAISVSNESLQRFAVANDDYQWKIVINPQANQVSTNTSSNVVYFGLVSGISKRYARRSIDSEVYALIFPTADKAINTRDWIKRDVLSLNATQFISIVTTDYQLLNTNNHWQLVGQSATEIVDEEIVALFTTRLTNLRVEGFAGGKLLNELKAAKPVQVLDISAELQASVKSKNGAAKKPTSLKYTFYILGDKHYVHREDVAGYFEISALASNDLLKLRHQWLMTTESSK
jgi:hypothetical protein